MMRLWLIIGVLGVIGSPASAEGTTGMDFLNLGTSARILALGGAGATAADDPTALYWNPGCLGNNKRPGVSLTQAGHVAGISFTDIAAAMPLRAARRGFTRGLDLEGTLAVGATLLDFGSIAGYDASGTPAGSYHPRASVLTLGYGWSAQTGMGTFNWGVAAKYISFKIGDSASSFAGDIGVMHRPADRVTLGAAVQNLGPGMQFDARKDLSPLTARLGASYGFTAEWLGVVEFAQARDSDVEPSLGAEYSLHAGPARAMLRAGWTGRYSDVPGANGLSFGVGVRWQQLGFDYALQPAGDLGSTHRISLVYRAG